MIIGPYERTSTIADYVHGKKRENYFDGLLIQIPEVDNEGNMVTDEKGILKAKHIWEMALPLKSGNVKNMPADVDTFLNTAYGMEDARNRLPDYTEISIIPEGLINLARGSRGWPGRERRCVDVHGRFGPLTPYEFVVSRTVANGKFIYEMDETDFETAMNLLQEATQAPLPDMPVKISEARKTLLSRAFIRQEEI